MKKFLSLMTTVLVGATLFAGCKKENSANSNTIKIGLNYELSGQVATYGRSLVEGIELAFEEINANGGVLDKKIEAVKMDNKSETAESANITTKLATSEKVVMILGAATSGNTKAAAPLVNQYKVPMVSASATADDVTVDKNGKVREYMFKTCFSDSFQGVIMAKFAGEDLGAKKAAMLIDNSSDYSKGLADSFKKNYTGEIVAEEAYKSEDTDFKAVLTNIKAKNPDVLFVPGYYEEVGLIIKQARELGLDVPVLGGDGYDSPKLIELAGKDALNKVYYTNHYSSQDTSEEVTKFRDAFKAKYNKEPDAFNALGYDLGYLAADAIKRAGKAEPEAIKEALAATKDFKAVTGNLSMDEKHNPVKVITILEVKDGAVTFLKKLEP